MQRTYEHIAARGFFFRSTKYLREQMRRTAEEINEIRVTLDARGLLMDMLTECARREPCRWARELEELVLETGRSLEGLLALDALLGDLLSEWREVKCAMGM